MFDIRDYYDDKNLSFKTPESRSEVKIREFLDGLIDSFAESLNCMLDQNTDFMKPELHHVPISFDLVTIKETKYQISPRNILDAIRRSNSRVAKDIVRRHSISSNSDGDFNDLLRDLLKSLKDYRERNSEEFDEPYDTEWQPKDFNGIYSEQELGDLINDYLNKELVTGEFNAGLLPHKPHRGIVLYLKAICRTRNPNETLISTFYHELFNAYHYLFVGRRFYSSWNYNPLQYDTVKSGLATFVEITLCDADNLAIARYKKSYIAKKNIRYYPAAAYNYINYVVENLEDDLYDDMPIFKYLFYISTYDIGEAYNVLMNMHVMIDKGYANLLKGSYNAYIEKNKAERVQYILNHKAPENICTNIRTYIRNYRPVAKKELELGHQQDHILEMLTVQQVRNGLPKSVKFGQVLAKYLDEKGIKDSDCYKSVNMNRPAFNKILHDKVHPSPNSVALLAIGLKLSSSEYNAFLRAAGYARSDDDQDPLNIVGFFIENKEYDIWEIEEVIEEMTGKTLIKYGE